MMRCQEHDRSHCPEPRCHVLAVCADVIQRKGARMPPDADIPDEIDQLLNGMQVFLIRGGWAAQVESAWPDSDPGEYALEHAPLLATRLVAWMRWDGALPCEACEGTGVHAYHGPGSCESCSGSGRVPGQHPLGAVMSHAERTAALDLVLTQCPAHGTDLGVFVAGSEHNLFGPKDSRWVPWHKVKNKRVLRQQGQYHECACRVAIGTNWATVAVLLDGMQQLGIGLGVVHEWRAPANKLEGCLYHSCAVDDGEECALGKMRAYRHECPYYGKAP